MYDAGFLWQLKSIGYWIDPDEDHECSDEGCVLDALEVVSLDLKTNIIVTKVKVVCGAVGLRNLMLSWEFLHSEL